MRVSNYWTPEDRGLVDGAIAHELDQISCPRTEQQAGQVDQGSEAAGSMP